MWDGAGEIYPLVGGDPNLSAMQWRFPTGARIKFAHMQYEKNRLDWQGAQIPLIGFDQLEHFTAAQFWYMLSRNRSTCGVRPYIRATVNPDPDSFVAELVAWWIDQQAGFAIPERAGVLRWFVRIDDRLVWFDSSGEAREQYPDIPPKSFTFIPAKVEDNPELLRKDPGYIANLMALPLVDRERLLGGNWIIRPAAGKVFNRGWFELVDAIPEGGEECRFWDFAATERETKGDDPDYTAGVKIRKVGMVYYVIDCVADQVGPADQDKLFLGVSRQDQRKSGAPYMVRWETEPASAGKKETWRLTTMLAGYDAKGIRPQGDKITRAKPLAAQAEVGNVKLLRGPWNQRWLQHMHSVPDGPHDDIMDATAGAFNALLEPWGLQTMPSLYD
uniref:Putative terminase n=1 Tax=viral metagenome TaxID=1070528 RepID=A0A6M3XBU2_9ZZZZ